MQIELANSQIIPLWPLGLVILAVLLGVTWRKKPNPWYVFCCAVFGLYVLFALNQIYFPIQVRPGQAVGLTFRSFDLTPFPFNLDSAPEPILLTLSYFLKLLLLVPFGFGINFVRRIKTQRMIWLAFVVGLGIELVRILIISVAGYQSRKIDINDALMYIIGILIGYEIFRRLAPWYARRIKESGSQPQGLAGYIYEVCQPPVSKKAEKQRRRTKKNLK